MNHYIAHIGNLKYALNIVRDEAWMDKITSAISDRVENLKDSNPSLGTLQITTLAFINFMNDFYELEEQRDELLAALEKADPEQATAFKDKLAQELASQANASKGKKQERLTQNNVPIRTSNEKSLKNSPNGAETKKRIEPSQNSEQKPTGSDVSGSSETTMSTSTTSPFQSLSQVPTTETPKAPARPVRKPGVSIDPLTGKPREVDRSKQSTAIDPLAPKRKKTEKGDINPFAHRTKKESYSIDPFTGKPRQSQSAKRSGTGTSKSSREHDSKKDRSDHKGRRGSSINPFK